ncbi:MAG: DUF2007 domain-containing protein [Rubripirellula sp.]|nr:DUF2007 domain-containing protein [Rubripirellula sp.]
MSALTSIRSCSDRFEAESLRIRLAEAGIRAVITGTDMETALGLGGAGTMRLVRLEVATEDAERATLILAEDQRKASKAGPWICSRCREQNEATFEVCWSCSKRRLNEDQQESDDPSANRTAKPQTTEPPHPETSTPATTPETDTPHDTNEETNNDSPHPFSRSQTNDSSGVNLAANDEPNDTLDEELLRTFRAAVIGAIVFPPLVSLYCLYLLIRLPTDAYRKRKVWVILIWILNLGLIASWTGFWINQLS